MMQTTQIVIFVATILTGGWFAAVLVQFLKREQWASSVKLVLAIVVAGLVGLAAAYLTGSATHFITLWKAGQVTAGEVFTFGALIFASAQAWFHHYFGAQGWAQTLGAIGSK
jgi:hypothetical protein